MQAGSRPDGERRTGYARGAPEPPVRQPDGTTTPWRPESPQHKPPLTPCLYVTDEQDRKKDDAPLDEARPASLYCFAGDGGCCDRRRSDDAARAHNSSGEKKDV